MATAVLAFLLRRRRRDLGLALAALMALLLAFPVVFFWLVAPANAVFMAASASSVPAAWEAQRLNWELGHALRFGLQVLALAALVLSLALGAAPAACCRPVRPGSAG